MKRKIALITMMTFLLVSVLAGCGSTQSSTEQSASAAAGTLEAATTGAGTPEAAESTAEVKKDPVQLKFALWSNGAVDKEAWDKLAADYNKLHPEITVVNETFDSKQYDSIYKARLAGGDGPDIYGVRPADLDALVKGGYAADLSGMSWFSELYPGAQKNHIIDGKPYAFPFLQSGNGFLYNKDIFTKYNISEPKTFDELLTICKTLKENNITPFAMAAKDNWWPQFILYYATAEHVFAKDPDFIQKINSGTATYSGTAGWLDAINVYKSLLDAGAFIPNPLGVGFDECKAMFLQGKAAMFPATWALADARKENINIGYSNLPTTNDAASGSLWGGYSGSLAINASNKHTAEAGDYIKFMLEKDNYHAICAAWQLFPVKDGVDVSDVDSIFGTQQQAWTGKTLYGSPSDNMLAGVQDAMLTELQVLTANKCKPEDVLKKMDEANAKALEQKE